MNKAVKVDELILIYKILIIIVNGFVSYSTYYIEI